MIKSLLKRKVNKLLKHYLNHQILRYHPWDDNYKWITNKKISTIIDIGANDGEFANHISSILPEAKIFSFEPIPSVFKKLKENTAHLNIDYFPFALGIEDKLMEMNVNNFSPSSSILNLAEEHLSNYKEAKSTHKEQIQMKRLDDFINKIPLESPILVKIDVQGFEDQVIAGGTNLIKLCKILLVEVSFVTLYEEQKLFDTIYMELKKLGFEFHGLRSPRYRKTDGGMIFGDATFLKKEQLK